MLRGIIWTQTNIMKRGCEPKDRIIEIDDCEIVDEVLAPPLSYDHHKMNMIQHAKIYPIGDPRLEVMTY
jgi:hypothetical protein